jgi:hypothetical protein
LVHYLRAELPVRLRQQLPPKLLSELFTAYTSSQAQAQNAGCASSCDAQGSAVNFANICAPWAVPSLDFIEQRKGQWQFAAIAASLVRLIENEPQVAVLVSMIEINI